MEEKNMRPMTHLLVLIAGCGLIGTCLGLGINVAGLFFTSIADDLQCGMGSASATLTIYNLMHAFTGMIAPTVLERFGLKKTVYFGTALQVLSTFLLSMAQSIGVLWLLNVLRGFAAGLIGTVSVTILINHWFHKDNALMTSIAIGFSGLAGALLSPLFSALIQNNGYRFAYQIMAGIALMFHLPALLFPISLRPEEKGLKAYGETEQRTENPSEEKDVQVPVKLLFPMVILYGICASATSALPPHFAGLAETYGLAALGAMMVSANMVMNTAGKVILGKWVDLSGVKQPVVVFSFLVALASLCLFALRNPAILVGSAGLYGLCFALSTVSIAVLTRDVFGPARYKDLYPTAALTSTIAHAVFTVVFGLLFDRSQSYDSSLILCALLGLCSLGLILCVYRIKEKRIAFPNQNRR